jgi:hypothetical protein
MAAAALDYCRDPMGEWLSLCAGVEVGWIRRLRVVDNGAERSSAEDLVMVAGPTLSTVFSYPADSVRPELRLSVRAPNLGGVEETQPLAFVAALGAGVPF